MRFLKSTCLRRSGGGAVALAAGCILLTNMSAAHALPSPGQPLLISHPLTGLPTGHGASALDGGVKNPWGLAPRNGCGLYRWHERFGGSKAPFVTFRAGLVMAPNLGFAGGLDFTIPSLSLCPQVATRLDADVLAAFNAHSFGGFPGTTFAFTLDQVYSPHWGGRYSPYVGAGIGPYWQESPTISGKVFAGLQFGSTVSSEIDVHLPGHGAAIIALEMRVSAL